jgi:hypothetical protein
LQATWRIGGAVVPNERTGVFQLSDATRKSISQSRGEKFDKSCRLALKLSIVLMFLAFRFPALLIRFHLAQLAADRRNLTPRVPRGPEAVLVHGVLLRVRPDRCMALSWIVMSSLRPTSIHERRALDSDRPTRLVDN